MNSQVPKGTRLGVASGLDLLLLLPAPAASDQGEDRPPAPLLALPSCSVTPCCFILLMKTLKLIYLGCVFCFLILLFLGGGGALALQQPLLWRGFLQNFCCVKPDLGKTSLFWLCLVLACNVMRCV